MYKIQANQSGTRSIEVATCILKLLISISFFAIWWTVMESLMKKYLKN